MEPRVAATSSGRGSDGTGHPRGAVHAWLPGSAETLCGQSLGGHPLRRRPLRRFADLRFATLAALDAVGPDRHVCPGCRAAAAMRRDRVRTGRRLGLHQPAIPVL